MRESNYSGIEEHCDKHSTFKTYVASLVSDFSRGNSVNMRELYNFVSSWLVEHIGSEDKKLADCVATEK